MKRPVCAVKATHRLCKEFSLAYFQAEVLASLPWGWIPVPIFAWGVFGPISSILISTGLRLHLLADCQEHTHPKGRCCFSLAAGAAVLDPPAHVNTAQPSANGHKQQAPE